MTTQELDTLFELHSDEYLKFYRIDPYHLHSTRPDLHLFITLDKLFPGTTDLLSSAAHDEIYFSIDPDDFRAHITTPVLIDMIRCGLRLDSECDSLCMFV